MLKGRAIFLTGGGTGLGRSMAVRFAGLGARMFLVGRREEPLREVCEEIHRSGGAAAYASCDVRDYAAVEAAAKAAEQQFGEIDALVNNAAGNFIARRRSSRPTLSTPWSASCSTARSTARKFSGNAGSKKTGRKRVEHCDHVCSSQLRFGIHRASACAKAGVLAMTTSLAVEWASITFA